MGSIPIWLWGEEEASWVNSSSSLYYLLSSFSLLSIILFFCAGFARWRWYNEGTQLAPNFPKWRRAAAAVSSCSGGLQAGSRGALRSLRYAEGSQWIFSQTFTGVRSSKLWYCDRRFLSPTPAPHWWWRCCFCCMLCCVPCLRIEIDLPLLFPNESVSFSARPAAFSHRGCRRPDVGHLRMCIARVFMHVG